MQSLIIVLIILLLELSLDIGSNAMDTSCGLDKSAATTVYHREADIEKYPWMGILYYPLGKKRFTTTVVLVTRQMVIAAASEIDRLPKTNFRANTRVVLGHSCDIGQKIRIRDYTYHPEYETGTISTLAMIQLDTDHVQTELRPICQPPGHFISPQFFAMTLDGNCKNPKINIYRMKYVDIKECRNFYRRFGMDTDSLWPVHVACARAVSGGRCVWRSGSVLVVQQDGRWRLLGFSVYGPGCGDPARFLDYGMYHQWVQYSSSTIGKPAITRLGNDHIIMRRSLANIQRYGPCDPEEKITEIYSDRITLTPRPGISFHVKYNVTLYAPVEYSCVVFRAREQSSTNANVAATPMIRLKRWCTFLSDLCSGFHLIELDFYVEIEFKGSLEFTMNAYGREAKIISNKIAFMKVNIGKPPTAPVYDDLKKELKEHYKKTKHLWYPGKLTGSGR